MKQAYLVPVIVLIIIVTGFRNATNPLYVTGKLLRHPHDKKERVFQIIVKGDTRIVAKTKTKKTGDFELSFTPLDEKYFDFFYIDPAHKADTMFLKSYTQFESDELKVTFYTYGRNRRFEKGKMVCPKCGKSDSVNTYDNADMHPGYYYCSRDRIKFDL